MYFQGLELIKNSKYSMYNEPKRTLYTQALESLDMWLCLLNGHKKRRINPLEFAQKYGFRWEVAAILFVDAEEAGVFNHYYELLSENGMEILIRTTDYAEIESRKTIYSENSDCEVPVNLNTVSIWYKLVQKPTKYPEVNIELLKKELAPPYNLETVEDDSETTSQIIGIMKRKRMR